MYNGQNIEGQSIERHNVDIEQTKKDKTCHGQNLEGQNIERHKLDWTTRRMDKT